MNSTQSLILKALIEAGGELTLGQLERKFNKPGRQIAGLNRREWTEYVRLAPGTGATGLRITQYGRLACEQ